MALDICRPARLELGGRRSDRIQSQYVEGTVCELVVGAQRNRRFRTHQYPLRRCHRVYPEGLWQDALLTHVDLNGLARQGLIDESRLTWLEAHYHWDHAEVALQWQRYGGKAWSDFGAVQARTTWQTMVTYFF